MGEPKDVLYSNCEEKEADYNFFKTGPKRQKCFKTAAHILMGSSLNFEIYVRLPQNPKAK